MRLEELRRHGIDEREVELRKRFFVLKKEDEELLKKIGEVLDRHADEIIEKFYEHLLSFPETKAYFKDKETINRVKGYQKAYFKRLTKGNYDLKYFEERLKIGVAHDRIKLPVKFYIGAYNKYHDIVIPKICKEHGYNDCEATLPLSAFLKIILLDMSLAIDAYIAAREAKLAESEEKFRALFEQSNDIIFIHNLSGKLIEVNQKTTDALGYTKEEILKIPLERLFPKEEHQKFQKAVEEINRRGFVHFESALLRKDGNHVFVDVNSKVIEFGGQKLIQMIIRDITERKKAEEELKTRVQELEEFHRLTVGREMKMIELEKKVKELEEKLKETGRGENTKI